jgi:deoxyribodipyrimidine photolyase-related protein
MPLKLRLVLGDQLNPAHSWWNDPPHTFRVVMIESRTETDYARHHLQKVVAFFAAMREFARWLREEKGCEVIYLTLDDPANRHDFPANLAAILESGDYDLVEAMEPDEYRLDRILRDAADHLPVPVSWVSSEHFLTERGELGALFRGKKRYLMETFYRDMRRRHGVLMDGAQPAGGIWNYDHENRRRLPKTVTPPPALEFRRDVSDLVDLLERQGVRTIGKIDAKRFPWPVTRTESLAVLDHFIDHCLPGFGAWQDAMKSGEPFLFHSRLSFALNVKLLHPLEVVRRVEDAWRADPRRVPLAAAEGFIRQILGWREYMRGIYWLEMPDYAGLNFFNHTRPLPAWFWTGRTNMNCLRQAIGQSLDHAYAHHIQRLMVTGNFAMLAGIHPDEVDGWYLGIYIDAIEWVEITNTRGMSQFADGGIVGTKPYASSANYIDRMSDYCAGCAYDKRKRVGPGACPFNSLYWHFHERHRPLLDSNGRSGFVFKNLDRMGGEERAAVLAQAEDYLANLESL